MPASLADGPPDVPPHFDAEVLGYIEGQVAWWPLRSFCEPNATFLTRGDAGDIDRDRAWLAAHRADLLRVAASGPGPSTCATDPQGEPEPPTPGDVGGPEDPATCS